MNRKGGGGSSNRQKGITMEDLKRQTAIRLAKEQTQRNYTGNAEDSVSPQTRSYPENGGVQSQQQQQNQGYPLSRYPQTESYREYQYSSREVPPPGQQRQQQYQHSYHHQQQQAHQYHQQHQNKNMYQHKMPSYENYPNSQYQHGGAHIHYESEPTSAVHYRNQNIQTQEMAPNSGFNDHDHCRQGSFPRGMDSSDPSAFNKLPHGLTVQELKEMTKARLQAEAAEAADKHEAEFSQDVMVDGRPSPLDFDSSIHEVRERTLSRDSTVRSQTLHANGSDSTNSIPSLVQVNQTNQNQHKGRQAQASPLPSGFQNFHHLNSSSPSVEPVANFVLPPHRQQQLKLDAIETASTNSYNNSSVISDNLGSESAFSSGIGSGMLSQSENDFAFNRSLSYTGGHMIPNEGKMIDGRSAPSSACASPASSSNMFFDAAVGSGNRRRSATLSPKPGSILEDQPHFDGQHLAMPNFGSSGRVSLLARTRTNSASSILTPNGSDSSLLGQGTGLFGLDESQNRPRTLSATSLPPISHTADEFGVDRVLTQQFVSQGREGPAPGYNTGGVFRDTSYADRQVRAPPGFSGSPGYNTVGTVPSNNRNRFNSVDALAGEMGSILTLSGEGQNRERLNTYPQSSRQTPEYISEEFFSNDAGGSLF